MACISEIIALAKKPMRLAWVGDYMEDDDFQGDFKEKRNGSGDYSGKNEELVGSWAWNLISISKEIPTTYKKLDVVFVEDY